MRLSRFIFSSLCDSGRIRGRGDVAICSEFECEKIHISQLDMSVFDSSVAQKGYLQSHESEFLRALLPRSSLKRCWKLVSNSCQVGYRTIYLTVCPFYDDKCGFSCHTTVDFIEVGQGIKFSGERKLVCDSEMPLNDDETRNSIIGLAHKVGHQNGEFRVLFRSSDSSLARHWKDRCDGTRTMMEEGQSRVIDWCFLQLPAKILCPVGPNENNLACSACLVAHNADLSFLEPDHMGRIPVPSVCVREKLIELSRSITCTCESMCRAVVHEPSFAPAHEYGVDEPRGFGSDYDGGHGENLVDLGPTHDVLAARCLESAGEQRSAEAGFVLEELSKHDLPEEESTVFSPDRPVVVSISLVKKFSDGRVMEAIPRVCPMAFTQPGSCSVAFDGWTKPRLYFHRIGIGRAYCRRYKCDVHNKSWTLTDIHRRRSKLFIQMFQDHGISFSKDVFVGSRMVLNDGFIEFLLMNILTPRKLSFSDLLRNVDIHYKTCTATEGGNPDLYELFVGRNNRNVLDGLVSALTEILQGALDRKIISNRSQRIVSLSFDSTYYIFSNVGYVVNGKWRKEKKCLTLVLSNGGRCVGYLAHATEDNETLERFLSEIRDAIDCTHLLVVSSDNAHSHIGLVRRVFGSDVLFCQDMWHVWMQRLHPSIPRTHPDAQEFRGAWAKIFRMLRTPGSISSTEALSQMIEEIVVKFSTVQSELSLDTLLRRNPYALIQIADGLPDDHTVERRVSRSTRYRRQRLSRRQILESSTTETGRASVVVGGSHDEPSEVPPCDSDNQPANQRVLYPVTRDEQCAERHSPSSADSCDSQPDVPNDRPSSSPHLSAEEDELDYDTIRATYDMEIPIPVGQVANQMPEVDSEAEDSSSHEEEQASSRPTDRVGAVLERRGIRSLPFRDLSTDGIPLMSHPGLRAKVSSILDPKNITGLYTYQVLSGNPEVHLGTPTNENSHGVGNVFRSRKRVAQAKAYLSMIASLTYKELQDDEDEQCVFQSLKELPLNSRVFKARYSKPISTTRPVEVHSQRFSRNIDVMILQILSDLQHRGVLVGKSLDHIAKTVSEHLQHKHDITRSPSLVRKRISFLIAKGFVERSSDLEQPPARRRRTQTTTDSQELTHHRTIPETQSWLLVPLICGIIRFPHPRLSNLQIRMGALYHRLIEAYAFDFSQRGLSQQSVLALRQDSTAEVPYWNARVQEVLLFPEKYLQQVSGSISVCRLPESLFEELDSWRIAQDLAALDEMVRENSTSISGFRSQLQPST